MSGKKYFYWKGQFEASRNMQPLSIRQMSIMQWPHWASMAYKLGYSENINRR